MEVLTVLSWIFGGVFLVFSLSCGVWGLTLWRKLMLIHHMLTVCRDDVRLQKLHKAGAKYKKEFREARWCFFLALDFATLFALFLARMNGLV